GAATRSCCPVRITKLFCGTHPLLCNSYYTIKKRCCLSRSHVRLSIDGHVYQFWTFEDICANSGHFGQHFQRTSYLRPYRGEETDRHTRSWKTFTKRTRRYEVKCGRNCV